MTPSTLTVTDFVLARIEEDEAAARAEMASEMTRLARSEWTSEWSRGPGDPIRVLSECAAKRRIVELRESAARAAADPPMGAEMLTTTRAMALNDVLRLLASIWCDHPDWREEWA